MKTPRDYCPDCDHKLHPQEMETLFRGRKLDCWYCSTRLKARSKFNLEQFGQMGVATWALIETLVTGGESGFVTMAAAGAIFLLVRVLPPGLVHGAPWVRVVEA